MRRWVVLARIVACTFALGTAGWCAGNSPVHIPAPGEPSWQITKNDTSHAAPGGYEGRTDITTETAVGNAPATAGQRVVARFELGNQIKTCPAADGTAEGTGVFSMTVDSTATQADGTSSTHIEMRATATYKGQVGDNGYLEGPVNAEIDYTYKLTGQFRGANGAIATPAGSNVQQHITIPFGVSRNMTPPSISAFSGGDPTKGHYAEALGVGAALAYWAGVYYSVAQTKWTQGQCAQIVFDPPSHSVQPALGAEILIRAEVKTKGGESSKANFQNAHARSGTVYPLAGPADMGAPIKFTYKAPDKSTGNAGFRVEAVSRAGMAEGDWNATLGTGWSGQISCSFVANGGQGHNEQQDWASTNVTRLTVDVKNGVGTAHGYAETRDVKVNRRKVQRGGSVSLEFDQSAITNGTTDGSSPATVEVYLNKAKGTYSINMQVESPIDGTAHTVICIRSTCSESDSPLPVTNVCLRNGLMGTLSDPNQLSGSVSDTQGVGNTSQVWTTTWRLARRGSGQ